MRISPGGASAFPPLLWVPLAHKWSTRSAAPYLGELSDFLAHFHVHLGITIHSPVRASAGVGFRARAGSWRVDFAVEGRCHRFKAPCTKKLWLALSLLAVCTYVREGFLQRGGRHCGPASTAAWLPFPEVPPSRAHSRTHLPLLVLVRWLAGSRAPAPCRVALALCTWGSRSADASERVRATPARGQLLRGLGEVCPEQVMFLGNWMVWGSQLRYERSSPRLTGRA